MVNPENSRLGDLLLDMRLVDRETLSSALTEQSTTGKRLPSVLAERRVLDEERLTKAVATRLGLEAVTVSSHKIHERVLSLIPYGVAKRFGILPIAIKRTEQAELLYLVMLDPLDSLALVEVQRLTGRQVRVLMATASELDQCIDAQYGELRRKAGAVERSRIVASRAGAAQSLVNARTAQAIGGESSKAAISQPGGTEGEGARFAPPRFSQSERPSVGSQESLASVSNVGRSTRPSSVEVRPAQVASERSQETATEQPQVAPPPFPPSQASASAVVMPAPSLVAPARPDIANIQARPPQTAGASKPKNPSTIIDVAPPESMSGLASQLGDVASHVLPSELDPPDAVETWVDQGLDSLGVSTTHEPDVKPVRASPVSAQESKPPSRGPRGQDDVRWGLEGGSEWSGADIWSGVAETSLPPSASDSGTPQPRRSEKAVSGDDWLKARHLDANSTASKDRSEEITTSTFDLSDEGMAALQDPEVQFVGVAEASTRSSPPEQKLLAGTLEVPVELTDEDNPFGGPEPGAVRTGLDRTGIFPAVDFESELFEPPDLAAQAPPDSAVGLSDIPDSAAAVRARFEDSSPPVEDLEDPIESIEEVVIESPEESFGEQNFVSDGTSLSSSNLAEAAVDVTKLAASESSNTTVDSQASLPPSKPPCVTTVPKTVGAEEEEPTNPRFQTSELPPPRAGEGAVTVEAINRSSPSVFAGAGRPGVLGESPDTPSSASRKTAPDLRAKEVLPGVHASRGSATRVSEPRSPAGNISKFGAGATIEAADSEEPTPTKEPLERSDVLDALDVAFVPPSRAEPTEIKAAPLAPPDARRKNSERLVDDLMSGSSLDSADRALLILALGRRLVAKGVLTRKELIEELSSEL